MVEIFNYPEYNETENKMNKSDGFTETNDNQKMRKIAYQHCTEYTHQQAIVIQMMSM